MVQGVNTTQDIVAGAFRVSTLNVGESFAKSSFTSTAPQHFGQPSNTATSNGVAVCVYTKKKRESEFCKDYVKGNVAVVKFFASELALGTLLLQLKRMSSTGCVKQWKKELRVKGKFCSSYTTSIRDIKRLHRLGFLYATKKTIYLKTYDEITTLCGGDPRHGNFYISNNTDIKLSFENIINIESANRQTYAIQKGIGQNLNSEVEVTKLLSDGIKVCEQKTGDDIVATCRGYAKSIHRKSAMTGYRHLKKLADKRFIQRTPRYIKTVNGDPNKSRYLMGEYYEVLAYGMMPLVPMDCRKRIAQKKEPKDERSLALRFYCSDLD